MSMIVCSRNDEDDKDNNDDKEITITLTCLSCCKSKATQDCELAYIAVCP